MTAYRLFDRRYALRLGTLEITDLDVEFDVRRSLRKEPNTADITVYNLPRDFRAEVEQSIDLPVELEAGYAEGTNLIFRGRVIRAVSEINGPDVALKIEASDGRAVRKKRVNKSYGKGVSLDTVVTELVSALGLGQGNLLRVKDKIFSRLGRVFPGGTTVSGSAADELGGLLESAGLEYSIQNEVVQILERGKGALEGTAVFLGYDFGLIETPVISSEGLLIAKTLMIPDLFPGRKIQMAPDSPVQGIFRVTTAHYTGSNAVGAQDWCIEVECDAIPS